jgi:Xaa-Pro aminopeptidase
MVITVEPGIYIPEGSKCDKKWWGIGIRIEDDVLIEKDKCKLLSTLVPRKASEIEKLIEQKSALDNFVLPPLKYT